MPLEDHAIQQLADEQEQLIEDSRNLFKNAHRLTSSEMMQLGESGPWQEHYNRQLAKR